MTCFLSAFFCATSIGDGARNETMRRWTREKGKEEEKARLDVMGLQSSLTVLAQIPTCDHIVGTQQVLLILVRARIREKLGTLSQSPHVVVVLVVLFQR